MALQSNAISHSPGANLESALIISITVFHVNIIEDALHMLIYIWKCLAENGMKCWVQLQSHNLMYKIENFTI